MLSACKSLSRTKHRQKRFKTACEVSVKNGEQISSLPILKQLLFQFATNYDCVIDRL